MNTQINCNIRYKIAKDISSLRFCDIINNKIVNKEKYSFEHRKGIFYFVDILETRKEDDLVKMKVFMPDGTVVVGWQFSWLLELHQTGNVFDGRFNA